MATGVLFLHLPRLSGLSAKSATDIANRPRQRRLEETLALECYRIVRTKLADESAMLANSAICRRICINYINRAVQTNSRLTTESEEAVNNGR